MNMTKTNKSGICKTRCIKETRIEAVFVFE